jgi:hypothetical protein
MSALRLPAYRPSGASLAAGLSDIIPGNEGIVKTLPGAGGSGGASAFGYNPVCNQTAGMEAVIPSLSRDLGAVPQARLSPKAQMFRLRRGAPPLNMTDPCTESQMRPLPRGCTTKSGKGWNFLRVIQPSVYDTEYIQKRKSTKKHHPLTGKQETSGKQEAIKIGMGHALQHPSATLSQSHPVFLKFPVFLLKRS